MKKLKAFTIIETLITLMAITIMIGGPLTFLYRSYTYSNIIKEKIIATGLAQEGLELATSLRNYNLNDFKTIADDCKTGCSADWVWTSEDSKPTFKPCNDIDDTCRLKKNKGNSSVMYRMEGDEDTDFTRAVYFLPNGNGSYLVKSSATATVDNLNVPVTLEKVIFNLDIK